jgi:hypothetical protein
MTVVEGLGVAPADSAAGGRARTTGPGHEDQRSRVRVLGAGT